MFSFLPPFLFAHKCSGMEIRNEAAPFYQGFNQKLEYLQNSAVPFSINVVLLLSCLQASPQFLLLPLQKRFLFSNNRTLGGCLGMRLVLLAINQSGVRRQNCWSHSQTTDYWE